MTNGKRSKRTLLSVQQLGPKGGRLHTTQLNTLDSRAQLQPLVRPRFMKKYTGNTQINRNPTGLVGTEYFKLNIVSVKLGGHILWALSAPVILLPMPSKSGGGCSYMPEQ